MKKRILMGIIMFVIIGILGQTNKVEAALQANGVAGITATLDDWIYYTRKMQEAGGTLGLTDTISDSDLSSSNKNLDIHFQKNTEYGAMAILSASAYGNSEKITDGGTTTGNASGIQVKLNGEWTAAGPGYTVAWTMKAGKPRYWNNYGSGNGSNSKIGDALAETQGWHGATDNKWLSHYCNSAWQAFQDAAFVRGVGGSIFKFWGYSWYGVYTNYDHGVCKLHGGGQWNGSSQGGRYTDSHYGRACVVVGTGV